MTSVSAIQIILTPTQPVGSGETMASVLVFYVNKLFSFGNEIVSRMRGNTVTLFE